MKTKSTPFSFLVIMMLFTAINFVTAQSISNYAFAYTPGYTALTPTAGVPIATLTTPVFLISSAAADDQISALTDIGFDFWFMGVPYSQFSVDDNGLLKLGSPLMTSEPLNSMASAINMPKIAPYWDDLTVGSAGYVRYSLEGTSPNRTLVVEWRLTIPKVLNGFPNSIFQVWLQENTGAVEFVYHGGNAANSDFAANPGGFSIGIGNSATDFTSITTPANTNAYGTANDANTVAPIFKTKYAYTATKPLAPSALSFTNVTLNSIDLNWTDNATDEVGYSIYKSTDGATFTLASTLPAGTTTATVSGLSAGISYSWRVYAFREVRSDILAGTQATTLTPFTGVKTIGPSADDYTSITTALLALQGSGFSGSGGVVFELQSDYNSNVETYPLTFPAALPTTASNALTIRPAADATALVITNGAVNAHTIYLNGAQYVIFDGRPGGVGTTSQLSITSGLTGSYQYNTIRVLNASNNTFRYCDISNSNSPQGGSPWAPGATIWFATGTGVSNNNNTIDNCSIHGIDNTDAGIACNLLYILSSPNTTISNNSFYDFGPKNNGYSRCILLGSSNGSDVTGNSIYQTATRTINYGSNIFYLNGGVDYIVSGNYFGGSAPLCGGSPMSLNFTSSSSGSLSAFYIGVGNTLPTSIQGNIIQNIAATFAQTGSFSIFNQQMGNLNIGTVTPNLIGSETNPSSISISNNSAGGDASFIGFSASSGSAIDFTTFSNNIFSGFSLTSTAGRGVFFTAVDAGAFYTANMVITNNTIGSTTLANSITNATSGTTIGIYGNGRNLNTITGNTIANITQTHTGTTNQVIAIKAVANPGLFNITGNTIRNITSASTSTGTGVSASIIGILAGSYNTAGQIISQNTIHSLSNTATSSTPGIIGIYYLGPGGTNTISRNFIHSFSLASNSTSAILTGIYADASQWNTGSVASFANNMIRLGIDASGAEINTGYTINGIYDVKGSNSYYNNSVFVGGTTVAGSTSNTYAFKSDVLSNTRSFVNNIFVNGRSGGTSGKHYAISLAGTTVSPAGLTCSHNLYFTSGTNGILGRYNGSDITTLTAWQSAIGQDNGSVNADPAFVNETGDYSTLDLHIVSPTPVEGAGTQISSVTIDFDGETRSTLTPNDIGADAGDFSATEDLTAPSISFTLIPNTTSTTNLTLSGFATITDNIGVSSGLNQPRLYYKRITDANAFAGNTSANNGWKYVQASNATSPYSFTIDYSLINGGVIVQGDVIQYFVVAQDDANNFASKFNGATTSSANDPVQNINACPPIASVNSYMVINNNISGTISVPGNYSTLTGPSGLFEAMNSGTVTGNVNVLITDNLLEPGTFALNQFAAPFTLTISPSSASLKTITANVDNGMIRFFGTDNVTIDGRFDGAGKYLEFYNAGSASYLASTFLFTNMANSNTIQYVAIKGQNPSGAIVKFEGIYPNTGNSSNNIIDHCDISNPGVNGNSSAISSYSNVGGSNAFNSITNCNIFDFFHPTGTAYGINLSYGSSDWTITGNSFYQTTTRSTSGGLGVIMLTDGTNHQISNNFIGGSAPNAGGSPWLGTVGDYVRVIYCFNNSGLFNINITNNTITNFNLISTNVTNGFSGINISSGVGSVSGNTIGSTSAADAIIYNGPISTAIQKIGDASMDITNNNIGGISISSGFTAISCSGAATNVNNNTIGSTTTANSINGGSGAVTGISGMHSGVCSFSDNTIANLTSNTGIVKGMVLSTNAMLITTPFTVDRNIIRNLTSGSTLAGTESGSSVLGLSYAASGNGTSISQNEIYNLANIASTGTPSVTGMYLNSMSGSVTLARNSMYGLTLATSDISAHITGIHIKGSYSTSLYSSYINTNFQNNIIRLGEGINTGYAITGILDEIGITSAFFNSVVLSGGDALNTDAKSSSYVLRSLHSNARNFQNNIFANTRVGGITGVNYAIAVAGTTPTPAGLTMNYNDYFVDATYGTLGLYNAAGIADLATWQTTVGNDVNSIASDPLFTSASNLIPQAGSPAIGAGTPVAGILIDFAGTTRNVPHTLGAFEAGACINPTSGGIVGDDMNGCAPFDPATITDETDPTGYTGTLEYKWQQSTTGALTGFSDIVGATSESYNPPVLTQTTWLKRLVRVNCKGEWAAAAESNVVTLTVNPELTVSVSISTTSNTVCAGTSVTFDAVAVNPGTAPVYQWKKNGSNVGLNSSTYTFTPSNGDQISCILTSDAAPCASGSPATSNLVTVNVTPVSPVSISIFASNPDAVCAGTSVSYFATPANGGTSPSYQWKVNGGNVGTNSNNFTYVPSNGDGITCVLTSDVTCPSGNPAVSNTVSAVVNPVVAVTATITPSADPVCAGTSVAYTANPVNGGTTPAYTWHINGGATVGTGSTYSYLPSIGDAITCVVTSNAVCPTGSPATATFSPNVNPSFPVGVNITAGTNPICAGTSATYTANLTNGGMTPSYEWHINGGSVVGSSDTYTYVPVSGDIITCNVVSSESCPVINNAVGTFTPSVNPILVLSANVTASIEPVCAGTSVTYTAIPTNGGVTPVFEWKINGGTSVGSLGSFTYTPLSGDIVSCIVTSSELCPSNSPFTASLNPTVESPVAAAGAITGTSIVLPGSTGVVYSVGAITNATSYVWTYSGTGVTINGTGASVTIDFSPSATNGSLVVKGSNSCGFGSESAAFPVSLNRTLILTSVLLEGLYDGGGVMRQASNETGPMYASGIADVVSVELHSSGNYSSIVYSATAVNLSTTGTITVNIPYIYSDSYYITIRHRNSIETTTANPVSFAGSSVSKSFASQADVFGGNLGASGEGHFLIYGGDVNQDGSVDSGDMSLVDNLVTAWGYGLTEDANSDGFIDGSDMAIVDNNNTAFISSVLP